jgi:hypothetical protein
VAPAELRRSCKGRDGRDRPGNGFVTLLKVISDAEELVKDLTGTSVTLVEEPNMFDGIVTTDAQDGDCRTGIELSELKRHSGHCGTVLSEAENRPVAEETLQMRSCVGFRIGIWRIVED